MVLVVGATGQLGGKVVRGLIAKGEKVRALVRPQSDDRMLAAAGAEIARGDLRDAASLERACAGCDTVITTANSARRSGDDNVQTVDRDGTLNLIQAAKRAGVSHFVYVSVLGADPKSPIPFLAAKAANEAALRASGMRWTILAPNMFMDSWPATVVGAPVAAGGPVTLLGEARRKHTFVCESDVAAFAVSAVHNDAARDRHVPIGGPEALSWRDVVSVYERVLGRPIEVRFAKPGDPAPNLPPAVLPILAATETYDSVFDTQASATALGVRLTTLEEFVRG